MWAGGDLVFLVAMILAVVAWLRAEEAEGRRMDAVLDQREARASRTRTDPISDPAIRGSLDTQTAGRLEP